MMGYGLGAGQAGSFWGLYMLTHMILPIAITIGVIWLLASYLKKNKDTVSVDNAPLAIDKTPLQILQERYAKGEINREEYTTIKDEITQI